MQLDNTFFAVTEGDICAFSLAFHIPIRFISGINILAVLIKKHTSVGKNSFQSCIIKIGGPPITIEKSVMQSCRCDFHRRMRSIDISHGKCPCKGTADDRKASAENISPIGTGAFKSLTGNQFYLLQRYRSAINFQNIGTGQVHILSIFAEGIEQFSVSDRNIRRIADGKQLLCDGTADGLAIQINGKFAGLRKDTVFRLVKSYIAEQFQR